MKKVMVRVTEVIYPNDKGGPTFPENVIPEGTILEAEDHGTKHGERHLRYFPKGSYCDCYLPPDSYEILQENGDAESSGTSGDGDLRRRVS